MSPSLLLHVLRLFTLPPVCDQPVCGPSNPMRLSRISSSSSVLFILSSAARLHPVKPPSSLVGTRSFSVIDGSPELRDLPSAGQNTGDHVHPPTPSKSSTGTDRRLIVGLGNPGSKYSFNRHNTGWMIANKLTAVLNAEPLQTPFKLADVARVFLYDQPISAVNVEGERNDGSGTEVFVVRPTTFMNLSGNAVSQITETMGIEAQRCLIIADDVNTSLGMLRFRLGRYRGTHNGLKSVSGRFAWGVENRRVTLAV
eukprot:GHVS01045920.1.p1 GENE.GHVS01045920.1~~GHVS01045920.1.p1  ORF type:complete len:255 (-),score=23.10 GHVS01045920.1:1045-1809(-)